VEFSNKNLALVLVVAIVVSLGGTIISLNKLSEVSGPVRVQTVTGRASAPAGYVNLTINSNGSCVIDKSINFGTGKPTVERNLSSDADNSADGFCNGAVAGTGDCYGLVINNTGNVPLNISFNSTKNGSGLLGTGATEADFTWISDDTELELNSCLSENTIWRNVEVSTTNTSNVCGYLNFTDASDIIVIDFNITVDQNTEPGGKNTTITIGCLDAS
jgi:hypothetical protein